LLRVALKEYQSRIEGLIEENRLPEAAAHCHFLLQQYPRHIGTYRLFGRALLEQQLFDDAIDVFHRVVSADPEDIIAHAGLALAYREKQDLTTAIWHMERAFEVEPYNGAIQEELRDLSARDGGVVRRGFGLNRAALARLYFRGGLYAMAATELIFLLTKFPDRFDLQVLLAETYYWEDRRLDAVNQCLHIMEQLPYCIKANAILADLWLRGGRFSDAREHLGYLQSLTLLTAADVDPNTTVGRALSAHPDISLPVNIVVDALDEVGPASIQFTYDTEWLQEIGVENESGTDDLEHLEAVGAGISLIGMEEADQAEMEDDFGWLKDVIVSDEEPVVVPDEPIIEPGVVVGESPGDSAIEHEDAIVDADGSEWEQTSDRPPELIEEQSEELGEFVDDLPSWSDLNAEEGQTEVDSGIAIEEAEWLTQIAPDTKLDNELPDWLYEAVGLTDELKMPADYEVPEWLQESADDSGGQFDESVGSEDSKVPQETPGLSDETGDMNMGDSSSVPGDAGKDKTLAGQDSSEESALPLPGWMDDSDEQVDSSSDSPFDGSGDLGFDGVDESIPWLEDLAGESGEVQADQRASQSADELSTDDQTDDKTA
jgi:tetratricopeptide (TPR) repeat protein